MAMRSLYICPPTLPLPMYDLEKVAPRKGQEVAEMIMLKFLLEVTGVNKTRSECI